MTAEATIHASCVAIDGHAVLISGKSGSGKSDLALRLLDRGATLVSDDYTVVRRGKDGELIASAPSNIVGKIEVRGLGIVGWPYLAEAPVGLYLTLDAPVERMPAKPLPSRTILDVDLPELALDGLHASAPIKVELALRSLIDAVHNNKHGS